MSKPPQTVNPAWGSLLAKHTSYLRGCARKYLNGDSEAINDLAQDAMVKALLHEHQFDPNTNLKAWLGTIVRNLFITDYQRKKKYQHRDIAGIYNDSGEFGRCDNVGEGELTIAELRTAVDSIPAVYGDVIRLRTEGYKYEEIAERLAIPIGTVKNRIYVAKQEITGFILSKQHNPNRMSTPTTQPEPISLDSTLSKQQQNCRAIMTYLGGYLTPDAYRTVDRDWMVENLHLHRPTLDLSLPALVSAGHLNEEKKGMRKAYRLDESFATIDYTDLNQLVNMKYKQMAETAKQKDQTETVLPQKVTKTATPKVENKPAVPAEYGFYKASEFVWFASRELAGQEAKEWASQQQGIISVDLVQRIGEVKVQPTVTFF